MTAIGTSGKYAYKHPVNPNAKMICGRTGIEAKYKDLTDAQIQAIIKAGNTNFVEAAKAPAKPSSN